MVFIIFNKFKVSKALYILKANYYYDETAEEKAQTAVTLQSFMGADRWETRKGLCDTGEHQMNLEEALHKAVDEIISRQATDEPLKGLVEVSVFNTVNDEDCHIVSSTRYVVYLGETYTGFSIEDKAKIIIEYDENEQPIKWTGEEF